jgi:BirA family biotin operon repressor/biotin-[acetyl-CoA-carboxylase] ligase
MKFDRVHLHEVGSTNTYIRENIASLHAPAFVYTDIQSAGRGQRGNTWEAEPYANLLFSLLWCPRALPANKQFSLSEAVALSIVDALALLGVTAMVKWPNDIYVADRKICGILIENSVMGSDLRSSVIGAGINLNQKSFSVNLPNPVSVVQLTGVATDIEKFIDTLESIMVPYLGMAETEKGREELHAKFMRSLWRGDGKFYPFLDAATKKRFEASICDVEPMGHLILRVKNTRDDGSCESYAKRRFAFKEVEFLLG